MARAADNACGRDAPGRARRASSRVRHLGPCFRLDQRGRRGAGSWWHSQAASCSKPRPRRACLARVPRPASPAAAWRCRHGTTSSPSLAPRRPAAERCAASRERARVGCRQEARKRGGALWRRAPERVQTPQRGTQRARRRPRRRLAVRKHDGSRRHSIHTSCLRVCVSTNEAHQHRQAAALKQRRIAQVLSRVPLRRAAPGEGDCKCAVTAHARHTGR